MTRESLKHNDSRININVLSVDLEDYFMVSAFENVVKRENWEQYESRIERNTYRLLEILDNIQIPRKVDKPSTHNSELAIHHSPIATFFCLGWVAEQFPHLITEIHSQGSGEWPRYDGPGPRSQRRRVCQALARTQPFSSVP